MIDKYMISGNVNIKTCLKKLDSAATGVLFVVDDETQLIGSISDGDIRRALLSGKNLVDSIESVYHHDPKSIRKDSNQESVRKLFLENKIEVLPIIDDNGKLVDILEWENFFGKVFTQELPVLNIPVVIMAGGKGTRMAPFTNVLPKPLVPIGDKTILELIIDQFRAHSIADFYFTLNYRGRMIEAYFDSLDKDYHVEYLWEKMFEGTAGSLKLLPEDISDNFILSNCDVIVKARYDKVLESHIESESYISILSSYQHYQIPYGVVEFGDRGEVTGLREKPEYSFPINTGVYIINKKALKYIPDSGLFHMTHLIDALIADKKKVTTYPLGENGYIDIGQWDEYKKVVGMM